MADKRRNLKNQKDRTKHLPLIKGGTTAARRLREPVFGEDNPANFIILRLDKKCKLDLTHPVHAEILINHLTYLRQEHWILLAGFVLLPEQFQVLLTPVDQRLLPDILKNFTGFTAQQINFFLKRTGPIWSHVIEQNVITDHQELRKYQDRLKLQPAEYTLIEDPAHWPWSSFHRAHEHLYDRDFFSLASNL